MIVVRITQPIAASRIVALVDVSVHEPASWRFIFRNCRWYLDDSGERIETPCGPFELLGCDEAEGFQEAVLRGAREHAAVFPLPPRERRKFPLWR